MSLVDHVNSIISILRRPEDSSLKTCKLYTAISRSEMDEVIQHSLEATSKLMEISRSYVEVEDTNFLKCEDVEVSTPDLYDSHNELYMYRDYSQDIQYNEFESGVDASKIAVGSQFATLQDAEGAFREYALQCGFNICKGNSKKDCYQELACSARGRARSRHSDSNRLRRRSSIKAMCRCHIVIRKREEFWEITSSRLTHTHKLLSKEELLMTAKNRFIPDDIKKLAISLYQEGSSPARIQELLETQAGVTCTWTMKDLYNLLYRYKRH